MYKLRPIACGLLSALFLSYCGSPRSVSGPAKAEPDRSITHAKRFAVARLNGLTYIFLMGKRNSSDTTAVYVLYGGKMPAHDEDPRTHFVKVPCGRVASLSSIYTQMFFELGALDAVKAIDNIDYVNNQAVLDKFENGDLPELARTPDIDVERAIMVRPEVVFTFGMGDGSEPDIRLAEAGIPVAVSVDHLEETPLARAEWIKFFAEFVGRRQAADSIFKACEAAYEAIRRKATGSGQRPTVFSEIKYSDAWYMPGGKSYIARLLHDAGADYLWRHDDRVGSLPLSFEEVFTRAKDADYWIHLSTVRTKKELLAYEPRYAAFKAFSNGNLFNNNKVTNNKGYSVYWESGMIHPERILSDLVNIFHPGLLGPPPANLYYYERIE